MPGPMGRVAPWRTPKSFEAQSLEVTWRVGRLGRRVIRRLISTLKGTLIGVMILISLQNNYLLSPPTLQVEVR